jgi:hypothetical protein
MYGSSGMTRDGKASLSLSNKSSSMREALRENTLKFTPFEQTVAPRGALFPEVEVVSSVGGNAGT